jgi:hypothetical protein
MIKAQAINGKAVVYPHRRAASILGVRSWSSQDESNFLN